MHGTVRTLKNCLILNVSHTIVDIPLEKLREESKVEQNALSLEKGQSPPQKKKMDDVDYTYPGPSKFISLIINLSCPGKE